jgi:transposase
MDLSVVHPRCCGLDLHKKSVVACLIVPGEDGQPSRTTRTFSTMPGDVLALSDWLTEASVTHVAMESTGVYWKPVYHVLEGLFTLLLVNPQHIKTLEGRKTDVKDAEWIATLLRHGLLKPSFVPEKSQRELRELIRYRTSLVRERAREVNRLQKTLEGAGIKLASVVSDLMGKSARDILRALVVGQTDAAGLAGLARGKLKGKSEALTAALGGRFEAHQRFLVGRQLQHIADLEKLIEEVSEEVAQRLSPFEQTLSRLETIPGVGRRTAELLVAEIGTDMRRFPTAGHLASWAGICPGQHQSAGKSQGGRTRKGSPWLRGALVEAAQAAGRTKGTYLATQYHRLAARRGKKRAAVAVGHSILVSVYHMLKDGVSYSDLGAHHYDERDREATKRRALRQLRELGYDVSLTPLAQAA